ncbi:hypothetical protein YZ82_08365 [Campylobacter hyointestinalis]|uniref:Uncharacterized protein n=1 Tax=Campylobacter hyointestinalis TaxID=198 RepID=A0A562X7F6_CAMHY|nr:hypothetical protein [Campylobacter hyointestinalis]ANE33851.1 putative membrane protein [Campylobacter hyointestinalis subsp. lawsonii CCUG 27631]TWO18011.1 hypothetical protein YZ82_08365 [Campylobacter hyointestinalis]
MIGEILSIYASFFKDFFNLFSLVTNSGLFLSTVISIPIFYILAQFLFVGKINLVKYFKNYIFISFRNIVILLLVFLFTNDIIICQIVLMFIISYHLIFYFIFKNIGIKIFTSITPQFSSIKDKDDLDENLFMLYLISTGMLDTPFNSMNKRF